MQECMKSKAKFLSFLFCLISTVVVLFSMSCKKGDGDGKKKMFDVTGLRLWGKDILGKDKTSVDPAATSKVLEITVGNCTKFKVTASLN